jgi:hypothetical protein
MKKKLTDIGIRSYPPEQRAIGDLACPGLCLRITPKGIKSFAFAYRNKTTGKVTWLTLGRYPDLRLARAREVANDARKLAAKGKTPLMPKAERIEAQKKTNSYAAVVALYFDAKLTTLRSGDSTRQTLDRIGRVYGWTDRPLASITDDEAAAMLHDIADRRGKKAMANRCKDLLHAIFKWAKQPS